MEKQNEYQLLLLRLQTTKENLENLLTKRKPETSQKLVANLIRIGSKNITELGINTEALGIDGEYWEARWTQGDGDDRELTKKIVNLKKKWLVKKYEEEFRKSFKSNNKQYLDSLKKEYQRIESL